MMKHSLGVIWLLLAVPAFAQTVPDLNELSPDQLPPAPASDPSMDLSIGTIYTSGEPDRVLNGCTVPGRPDWIIEINPTRNVEQWLVSAIWAYIGGTQVVETGDCLCEKRFPSWELAMEYFDANYAGMERSDMNRVRLEYGPKSRNQVRSADEMCKDGYR